MFDWRAYMTLATALIDGSSPDQSRLRAGVSRAYYAVFHLAMDRLPADERHRVDRQAQGEGHRALWEAYKSQRDGSWQKIGHQGDRLKIRRVAADYNSEPDLGIEDAKTALQSANRIITLIDDLR